MLNSTLATLKNVDSVCFESIGRSICGAICGAICGEVMEVAAKRLNKMESDTAKFGSVGLTRQETRRTVELINRAWVEHDDDVFVVFVSPVPYRGGTMDIFGSSSLNEQNLSDRLCEFFAEKTYTDHWVGKLLLVSGREASTFKVAYNGRNISTVKWGTVDLW